MSNQATNEQARVKSTIDLAARSVTITASGRTMIIPFYDLNEEVTLSAIAQGIVKKVTDGAAIGRDPSTGLPATMETKWACMQAIRDRIVGPNGVWNADPKRAAQARKEAQEAQEWEATLIALCTIKGTTTDTVEGTKLVTWANAKGREAVTTLRNAKPEFMAAYASALAMLKAKAAPADSEQVDDLLDELDAL